jgi:hypothetical protein
MEIALPISKKPDINQKLISNQISKIEMKIGEAIIDYLGLPIIRQMLIYNPYYPAYPFEIDIYIPSKDIALDVNGKSHKTVKVMERQKRKTPAITGLTGIQNYYSIDVSTPPELLYWNLKGEERENIKRIYDIYSDGLIMQAVNLVKKTNFSEMRKPRILQDEDLFQKGLARLQELKKQ